MLSFIEFILRACRNALPLLTILAIPLGFIFLEYPSNELLGQMDPFYMQANIFIAAAIFLVFYGFGQRSRASIIAYLAVCLLAGVANYFVVSFKGQPITPADLSALSTAASVSSGYGYALNARSVICILLFAGICAAIMMQPKRKTGKTDFKAPVAALNIACATAVTLGFATWFNDIDIEEGYDVSIDAWSTRESYAEQGAALCFLKQAQDIAPVEPDGYDRGSIASLLAPPEHAPEGEIVHHANYETEGESSAEASPESPTVIAIMNETFSDLSRYPGMSDSAASPQAFKRISNESLVSGDAYVSALGGGTCNSEFEFLTSSSMGHMGGGVYPYTLYDLSFADNLAEHFKGLGYSTHAIHPESATNWSRNRVYDQLGFDTFTDKSSFADSDTLRGMTTDRATYEHILEMLQKNPDPQFIFDVTMQNHGGYDTGLIPENMQVRVELPDSSEHADLDEYASCINQSDADLEWFVQALEECGRPIILCFFGDHQPGFVDDLFKWTHDGVDVGEMGIDGAQERYVVPYLIWGNQQSKHRLAALGLPTDKTVRTTSLNYLGSQLCEAAGVPLSGYQRFVLGTADVIPAMNLNGFMDAQGEWHGYGWEVSDDLESALNNYSCVQYDNIFNKDKPKPTQEFSS